MHIDSQTSTRAFADRVTLADGHIFIKRVVPGLCMPAGGVLIRGYPLVAWVLVGGGVLEGGVLGARVVGIGVLEGARVVGAGVLVGLGVQSISMAQTEPAHVDRTV